MAWEKVLANRGCGGVDGESVAKFAHQSDRYLTTMLHSLANQSYQPLPLRQIFIPKKTGGWRELQIPTVRDRIVQQAILNVLHPYLEREFADCSFAYRPGRSHRMAVDRVRAWHHRGYDWVLDADLVEYFANIQHDRLLAELQERVDIASELLELITKFLQVGVLTPEGIVIPRQGLAQGSVISPILANVYLDDFDEAIPGAGVQLVRYADDFVVLAKSQTQITKTSDRVVELLETMGLALHPQKTQIVNFDRGFRFLGSAFVGDLVVPVSKPKAGTPLKSRVGNAQHQLIHTKTDHRHPLIRDKVGNAHPTIYSDPPATTTPMQLALAKAIAHTEQPIPPPLYVVLGYEVREQKPVSISSNELPWREGMAALYLVQQGATLRREQGRFLVQVPEAATIEVLIKEVEQVLVLGNIQITTSALTACLEAQIPVIFLTQMGEYKGHLWSAELRSLETEAAQWGKLNDLGFQLQTAQGIVRGKLANSRQLLLRLNRKRRKEEVAGAIAGMAEDLGQVAIAETLESLRGYEGIAAARYFPALGQLITQEGFTLTTRTRRPPKDPVNSLLSFGYTLLFNNVFSAILVEGLHPYLGNLHRSDRPDPQLAFDLMEEWRSPIVDSLVIAQINKQTFRPTDFTWFNEDGGTYLSDPARRIFLRAFEARMGEKVNHPDVQEKVSFRRAIQLQVRRYVRAVRSGVPYEAFVRAL